MDQIDRASIFEELCRRNQLRRDAQLPLLDFKAEYSLAITVAKAAQRRAIRKQYEPDARAEVLARMRAIHGATWPRDLGSRYLLGALVDRLIFERHGV
jgi:hypothetical protein